MSDRRYPLAPLATALGLTETVALADRLGVNRRSVHRYRDNGIPETQADRLAVTAGLHPFEVWPEMAEHRIDELEARRRAKVRAEKARYREAHRDEVDAYQRAYREANRDRARRYRAAYYRRNRERELARQREYDRKRRGQRPDERESA